MTFVSSNKRFELWILTALTLPVAGCEDKSEKEPVVAETRKSLATEVSYSASVAPIIAPPTWCLELSALRIGCSNERAQDIRNIFYLLDQTLPESDPRKQAINNLTISNFIPDKESPSSQAYVDIKTSASGESRILFINPNELSDFWSAVAILAHELTHFALDSGGIRTKREIADAEIRAYQAEAQALSTILAKCENGQITLQNYKQTQTELRALITRAQFLEASTITDFNAWALSDEIEYFEDLFSSKLDAGELLKIREWKMRAANLSQQKGPFEVDRFITILNEYSTYFAARTDISRDGQLSALNRFDGYIKQATEMAQLRDKYYDESH